MTEPAIHVSVALGAVSLMALAVDVPRQLLGNYGFLDKYVDVELPRRQRALTYLTLIGTGLILATYVTSMLSQLDRGVHRDSAARLVFIAMQSLIGWTMHLALKPNGGLLEPLIAKYAGRVLHRLRLMIYLVAIGFPLLLSALSALGYGFTAQELMKRALITLSCFQLAALWWSGCKILASMAWQGLTGTTPVRRYDAYGEIKPEGSNGVLTEHYLELKYQLAFLCKCCVALAAAYLCVQLWIDAFPSVRVGNPVLYTVQSSLQESTVDDLGRVATSTIVSNTSVTALHLVLAAATLFVAFQLAKLLPGLFDALVLQRVSFDEGMEHFALVAGRIVIFGAGCLLAGTLIGLHWDTLQWLAVGLTIGLGFGLQDMVRNLLGGIVVLFEKPAQRGDLVTIGRVTGRVAFQSFRTTVLSDEHGREIIVPNKNFVSEEVTNWMGAGRLKSITFEVAVTRDQRPVDICRMLQQLILQQPDVLVSPAPQATLICVGKHAQRIELCAWIDESLDGTRCRDGLLNVALKFLREKDWLTSPQPKQPALKRDQDDLEISSKSLLKRSRRTA